MNSVILAGGIGNRLMPLTASTPKPMLLVGNVPMLDYSVCQLAHFGIENIVFTLAYLPEQIIKWTLGYKDIKCNYSIEITPRGTLGGIIEAANYLDDLFFVLSGDGVSNINLDSMYKKHMESRASLTMAVTRVKNPSLYGVVSIDEEGFVTSFKEKPSKFKEDSLINCGVYLVDKRLLSLISRQFCDFSRDLFPLMLDKNLKIAAHYHDGYWDDVGSLESYHATNNFISKNGAFYKPCKNFLRNTYQAKQ